MKVPQKIMQRIEQEHFTCLALQREGKIKAILELAKYLCRKMEVEVKEKETVQ